MPPKGNQSLSPNEISDIQQAVFDFALAKINKEPWADEYFLLAVDFEKDMGHWYLRIYVDRANKDRKMMLEDCEKISRLLDEPLDNFKALGNLKYNLEVSSPGLFRALKNQREFDFYAGQAIEVKDETENQSKKGILGKFETEQNGFYLTSGSDESEELITLKESIVVHLNPPVTVPD